MRFRFERQAHTAVRLTWGHGRYLDPWSFLHVLTGFLLGVVGLWLSLPLGGALVAVVALTALYEAFEMALGIVEDWQNALLDVLVAAAGTWAAYAAFAAATTATQFLAFAGVGFLALLLLFVGWRKYLRRRLYKE